MEPLQFNNLQVRLAENAADIDAAQALRYRIFHEELGARADQDWLDPQSGPGQSCESARPIKKRPDSRGWLDRQRRFHPTTIWSSQAPHDTSHQRDVDAFDDYCDHLLVIDLERGDAAAPCVVGTYRMLRGAVAKATSGFYTADEFDLGPLLTYPGEIMELGRSCIERQYRRRGAMQLLWAGIGEYISLHDVQVMFGCGSLHGTDPVEIRLPLAYLYHYHCAPRHLRPRAVEGRYVAMDTIAKDTIDSDRALAELPPLLKGYLRLGGYVGDGAVIDYGFNTVDVCIVVETKSLAGTYNRHFVRDRAAAQQSGMTLA